MIAYHPTAKATYEIRRAIHENKEGLDEKGYCDSSWPVSTGFD